MKNSFVAMLAIALLLGGAAPVFAQEVGTTTPVIVQGNGDPNLVMQVWGLTGAQTPRYNPGESVKDEAGEVNLCPSWYPKMGCANITGTAYYRNSHIEVARQLITKNMLALFPSFEYWAKFAR